MKTLFTNYHKMATPSTKQKLLSLIEDVEIISKEIFEGMSSNRGQRSDGINTGQLIELLVVKDKELKETLKIAEEQAEQHKKLDALKALVEQRDNEIRQLQKSLKEAETILSSAIYQAKQKLQAVNQAQKRKVSSEELIKYAHMISSSNAVAAPPTWAPGDPRRPYPTDLDMRHSFLSRAADMPIGGTFNIPETIVPARQLSQEHPVSSQAGSLSWPPSIDLGSLGSRSDQGHGHGVMDSKSHNKENEVEEMNSSDSSSSSSSDE